MRAPRAPHRRREFHEALAVGAPELAVADEDREVVADLLAEILIASLEREVETTLS